MHIRSLLLAASLLFVPLATTGALAADTGGSSVPSCPKGKVYDQKQKKCVEQKSDGSIDDDSIYNTGRQLALQGRYDEAISVLSLAANKSDPRILNYLGYSHRHLGRVAVGVGYYEEALRINPDYTLVREYLGEAHLQVGDVDGARQQLAEIEKRCGKTCDEYTALSTQIDAFAAKKG